MAFEAFLQSYGWYGFIAYVVVKEVWPFLSKKYLPHRMAQATAERNRLEKLEERAIANDERQTKALEEMNTIMRTFTEALTANNERLAQLVVGSTLHDQSMQAALMQMRERIAANTQPLKA